MLHCPYFTSRQVLRVRCADVPLASPDSGGEWSSTVIGFARVVPALKRPMSAADFCNGYACAHMHAISYACRVTYPYICKSVMAVWLVRPDTNCSTLARAPPQPRPPPRMQTQIPAARRRHCRALSSCQRARPPPALKRTRRSDARSFVSLHQQSAISSASIIDQSMRGDTRMYSTIKRR